MAPFLFRREAARLMAKETKEKGGVIINIASR
jgi:NAD(P)-dependent dehydrogenase (short-subunit alcohol dehydrogenase family)